MYNWSLWVLWLFLWSPSSSLHTALFISSFKFHPFTSTSFLWATLFIKIIKMDPIYNIYVTDRESSFHWIFPTCPIWLQCRNNIFTFSYATLSRLNRKSVQIFLSDSICKKTDTGTPLIFKFICFIYTHKTVELRSFWDWSNDVVCKMIWPWLAIPLWCIYISVYLQWFWGCMQMQACANENLHIFQRVCGVIFLCKMLDLSQLCRLCNTL